MSGGDKNLYQINMNSNLNKLFNLLSKLNKNVKNYS